MTKELFFARNHPNYQRIEINDSLQYMMMPEEVKQLWDQYSSISISGSDSSGEDFDYALQAKNREVKSYIPSFWPLPMICGSNYAEMSLYLAT